MNFDKTTNENGLSRYRFHFDDYSFIIFMADNNDLYWNCLMTNRDIEKPTVLNICLDDEYAELNNIIGNVFGDCADELCWCSDDGYIDNAQKVYLKKGVNNNYHIIFDKVNDRSHNIRFCTNGSRNPEVCRLFLQMYKQLDELSYTKEKSK